ncbi:MAG: hypothetical protein ACLGIR_10440 [Actinomycetes bacterium]
MELLLAAAAALAVLLTTSSLPRPAARRVRADDRPTPRRQADPDGPTIELHDFRDDEPVWHERPAVVGTALVLAGLLALVAAIAAVVDL